MIDPDDQQLLRAIQREVPLSPRPYAQIAAQLGRDEEWVLQRVRALREGGVIREISGILDAPALGYRQALVAMELPPARLDDAGELVARHPGVSHCYGRRGGKHNLWFTLAVSPQSALGLERTVARLSELCIASAYLILPTIKRYKLRMEFFGESAKNDDACFPETTAPNSKLMPDAVPPSLSEDQISAVRALQIDLPCCQEPFASLASDAGMTVERLLELAKELLVRGFMRRYAAVLHHRAAGAEANVMVAWRVAPAAADAAGARCAAVVAVSHCYLRPTAPDWPYNLYTMIHGRSRADCELAIAELAAVTGLGDRCELWTDREYKKQRVRLLDEREREWETSVD
jgi:DNA-binding Lrp family transcriptional regulator